MTICPKVVLNEMHFTPILFRELGVTLGLTSIMTRHIVSQDVPSHHKRVWADQTVHVSARR